MHYETFGGGQNIQREISDQRGEQPQLQERDPLRVLRIVAFILVYISVAIAVGVIVTKNPAATPAKPTSAPPSSNVTFHLGSIAMTIDSTPDVDNNPHFVLSYLLKSNLSNGTTSQLRGWQPVYLKYPYNLLLAGGGSDIPIAWSFFVNTSLSTKGELFLYGKILQLPQGKTESTCYNVKWESPGNFAQETIFEDCYDLGDSPVWYGAAELQEQLYNMRDWNRSTEPFLPRNIFRGQLGGVMERYFLSWNGFAIYVDWNTPLFVTVNDNKLCLKSQIVPPYKYDPTYLPQNTLNYYLCAGPDVATIHREVISRFYQKPSSTPHPSIFQHPVWSTWARDKDNITQQSVLELAYNIVNRSFAISNLEIHDSWTPKYGDLQFDTARFPNATEMVRQLHSAGMNVTLWVIPFANVDSSVLSTALQQGKMYWLQNPDNKMAPLLVEWWRGVGAVLDTSNPVATEWFISALRNLTESVGVDGFKFDAGETQSLGSFAATSNNVASLPWIFTTLYAQMAATSPGNSLTDVRVGCGTQKLSLFVTMLDRVSDWSATRGLNSIIPTALAFSMAGYPFVMPDIIGGVVNCNSSSECIPDRELYIRWLELTAFLPVMPFSVPPWTYDDQVLTIALRFTQLHAEFVTPRVLIAAQQSIENGYPILRPMWWICPTDPRCSSISDQFMVGDDLLVAPVLAPSKEVRKVFLPPGTWYDYIQQTQTVSDGMLMQNYSVPLGQVAYFTKIN